MARASQRSSRLSSFQGCPTQLRRTSHLQYPISYWHHYCHPISRLAGVQRRRCSRLASRHIRSIPSISMTPTSPPLLCRRRRPLSCLLSHPACTALVSSHTLYHWSHGPYGCRWRWSWRTRQPCRKALSSLSVSPIFPLAVSLSISPRYSFVGFEDHIQYDIPCAHVTMAVEGDHWLLQPQSLVLVRLAGSSWSSNVPFSYFVIKVLDLCEVTSFEQQFIVAFGFLCMQPMHNANIGVYKASII